MVAVGSMGVGPQALMSRSADLLRWSKAFQKHALAVKQALAQHSEVPPAYHFLIFHKGIIENAKDTCSICYYIYKAPASGICEVKGHTLAGPSCISTF